MPFCFFLLHYIFFSLSPSSFSLVFLLVSSLSPSLCSLFMDLNPFDLMTVRFPFHLRRIVYCCSLGIPCLCVMVINSQRVANFPLANYAKSSLSVWFFDYVGKWLIHHLNDQIGPQILIDRSLIPYKIEFFHRVHSQSLDLEPLDPTSLAHFAQVNFSTVSVWWAVVFSLLYLPCLER